MGVQGRMNQEGGNAEDQAKAGAAQAIDQKRRAQEQAKSIGQQVREKVREQYQGTT
jgi:hypothetical protein